MAGPAAGTPNFAEVDTALLRGGRPDAAGAQWLAGRGVLTVINLEWEERDEVVFAGLPIKLIRLADFEPLPTFAPKITDQHVVDFLARLRVEARPAFVHCRSGINRTGVMVAAYRLLVKSDPLDAVLAEFASYHGAWEWGDERYLRTLPPRAAALLSAAANCTKGELNHA
jgi:tyrosine-protein phosphatase SIW14